MSQIGTYLLTDAGLASLDTFIDPSTLFAFDLDGTLAPIVDDAGCIEVSAAIKRELSNLKKQATLAIITGRSRRDAQKHLGLVPNYLIGNHGAEGLPGWEAHLEEFKCLGIKWEGQLRQTLPAAASSGIVIENKGASVSIHYRHAPNRAAARTRVLRSIDRLEPKPRRVSGKFVENLLPEAAPDKGVAILELMRQHGHPKGFFVGDDVTDEDVFRMKGDHLFTVYIGSRLKSSAQYFLKNQKEILLLLPQINAGLRQMKTSSL
jgi:trehalose 6-phosphate phosphatase